MFIQLVRQEMTMPEAADHREVDRGTIMRISTVAKEGAFEAPSCFHHGPTAKERDFQLEAARAHAKALHSDMPFD